MNKKILKKYIKEIIVTVMKGFAKDVYGSIKTLKEEVNELREENEMLIEMYGNGDESKFQLTDTVETDNNNNNSQDLKEATTRKKPSMKENLAVKYMQKAGIDTDDLFHDEDFEVNEKGEITGMSEKPKTKEDKGVENFLNKDYSKFMDDKK